MERHRRTVAKTITWRFMAVAITWVVVYFITKDVKQSTVIALAANGLKTALYYLHERLWSNIPFGTKESDGIKK
ncbi:MAG: DUF2061 domain-containing protein [Candidatus Omnitrophota bacterium]